MVFFVRKWQIEANGDKLFWAMRMILSQIKLLRRQQWQLLNAKYLVIRDDKDNLVHKKTFKKIWIEQFDFSLFFH